jgi:hypothetical protein
MMGVKTTISSNLSSSLPLAGRVAAKRSGGGSIRAIGACGPTPPDRFAATRPVKGRDEERHGFRVDRDGIF